MDDAMCRYAANYWLSSKYFSSRDLVEHGLPVAMAVAVIRFIFLGSERVVAMLGDPERGEELDAALVAVVTAVSRDIAHAGRFVDRCRTLMLEEGRDTLAWSIMLCRF